jgi:NAD(P)-dependent dehydrogenase (short-subunit alcohol dehydrogenase family)
MTVLAGHNCLVTGASRGLGAKIAAAFWNAGANLILVARSEKVLEVASNLPRRAGQRAVPLTEDLSDPLSGQRIVTEARKIYDSLDVLVNNAAIHGPIGTVWKNDWRAWQMAVQVDLLSPVALCRRSVPWMLEFKKGKIINLSGGGATGPRPNFSAYATAKAGLIRFSETLAEETRGLGIDVNCIAPGAMDTDLTSEVLESGPSLAGQKEYEIALKVREGGGALPDRATDLCVFLASSASDGITGKLISAVWDPWEEFPKRLGELKGTDNYTLRRIVPKDRGKNWGDR